MEFAFKYEMWELLRHEKIPETQVLATLLTGNAWLFDGKNICCILGISKLFQISRLLKVVLHRFYGKFTLNLCDAQVFKTKNSEISC